MIRLLDRAAAEGQLTVAGPGHHYLTHVHRLNVNDGLEVFDGKRSLPGVPGMTLPSRSHKIMFSGAKSS